MVLEIESPSGHKDLKGSDEQEITESNAENAIN